MESTGTTLRCDVDADQLDALLAALHDATVVSLECHPPSLESIFLSHYATTGGGPTA